ncbi:MAG: OmpH family outer membrane protein [Deltaproteobacteria bacterium]|nr:MAG: OmpH family outer membrane protein [Deltaproteobacteria bacterium]
MKKGFLFSAVMIAVLLAHGIGLGEDSIKIGLVDLQRCLQESKEGQKVINLLKDKKAALQRQFDTKQKELLELRQELEKQAMMLSMDAQEDKKKTIERKTRELEYFYKDLNEEMIRAQEKEKKEILKELSKIIEKIGAEGNYTLITERKAGGVLYCADSVDITEKVIKAYDQMKEESKK